MLKMRSSKIFIIAACLIASAFAASAFIDQNAAPAKTYNAGNGFAVVELFTSEGCSSCPPADAVVAKIEKESAGKPVYILAFHVDYWNRLGWKDVFSSAEYSRRQNQYAQWLHLQSVYTPQIVVNGKTEFVGSEEGTLRNAIKAGLETPAQATIMLGNIKVEAGKAKLQYQAQGISGNTVLILAVVQKSAQTKVERGENGGRTLLHVQIVRSLAGLSLKKDGDGSAVIALPKDFNGPGAELIAFLQDASTGAITGAGRATF